MLIMRIFSDKSRTVDQNPYFAKKCYLEKIIFLIIWKNMVEADSPHTAI
jgi:hypothetical protein